MTVGRTDLGVEQMDKVTEDWKRKLESEVTRILMVYVDYASRWIALSTVLRITPNNHMMTDHEITEFIKTSLKNGVVNLP